MSEQETGVVKHETPGPHRWRAGQSGNPRGRQRRPDGERLAPLLREQIPTSEIVAKAKKLLGSENESLVLQALQFVATYSGHKPADKLEVGPPSQDEEDTSACTDAELQRLDELEIERAAILERAGARLLTAG